MKTIIYNLEVIMIFVSMY